MINWKPQEEKYGGGESCFGIAFREEYPQLAELMSQNGLYKNGMSCSDGKYDYTVKVVQNGKYVFVTRKLASNIKTPSTTQASTQRNNGDEGWKKGHEENIQMHKEQMDAIAKLTAAIEKLTAALEVREAIEDTMRQHLENIDRHLTKLLPLPTAAELQKKEAV